MNLDGKKILVAGGAGFVGSQLVRNLLDKKANLVVYDNLLAGRKENLEEIEDDIELVTGDILNEWLLIETFRDHKFEYVFDLVGDTFPPMAYLLPKRFLEINTLGTLNILHACEHFNVKRMEYVSSTEVYGEGETSGLPLKETQRIAPLNTYAVSKTGADLLCQTFYLEHGTPVIIPRIFNCFGKRETHPYVIPEIIRQFSKGYVLRLGNLKARRDFTYVSDTADALIRIMFSKLPNGSVVNVGSGTSYSVEEIASKIASLMGIEDFKILIEKKRLRKCDIQEFLCDNTKLKSIGWKPKVSFEDGLKKTIGWFREHKKRWGWEGTMEGSLYE